MSDFATAFPNSQKIHVPGAQKVRVPMSKNIPDAPSFLRTMVI